MIHKLLIPLLLTFTFWAQVPAQENEPEPFVSFAPDLYPELPKTAEDNYTCEAQYTLTDKEPFMISEQYKNETNFPTSKNHYARNWDNFRLMQDASGVSGYIPQGTIVRLINPDHKSYLEDTSGKHNADLFVPVEVVNIPNNWARDHRNEHRKALRDVLGSDGNVVREGQTGRIHSQALRPASGFTYIINDNTFLTKIPGLDDLGDLNMAKAVELVTKEDNGKLKYQARKCCLDSDASKCIYKYRWRILNSDLEEMGTFDIDPFDAECSLLEEVRAVSKNQAQAVLQVIEAVQEERPEFAVKDLDMIDSLGLIRWPVEVVTDGDVTALEGPYNSSYYNPDEELAGYGRTDGKINSLDDSFINATTGCALTQVLKRWNELHPNSTHEVQLGDMWHLKTWDEHGQHEIVTYPFKWSAHGTCFDIRPLSSTSDRLALTLKDTGIYSRPQTQKFVTLVKKAGAEIVYFNDLRIEGLTNKTRFKNHDHHIHICMNPANPTVQKTCARGL